MLVSTKKKYRNKQEITAEILKTVLDSEGMTKVKIMYAVYTSWKQLAEYIDELVHLAMLRYDTDSRKYPITG